MAKAKKPVNKKVVKAAKKPAKKVAIKPPKAAKKPAPIRVPKPKAKGTVHYADNKRLTELMTEYSEKYKKWDKKKPEEKPQIPDYVATCIIQIAERLATKPNFSHYSFKQEMVDDGILNIVQYLHNFDRTKSSNAFSYFTQIIYFAFLRRIEKHKKEDEGVRRYRSQVLTDMALASPLEAEEFLDQEGKLD